MLNPRSLLLAIAACAWLATSAAAQETGSISGAVFDSNGGPVAGVVITVSGPQLPRGRTFTTNESGMYQFLRLLPGTYTVEASKPDLGSSKRDIIVELDRDARVDVVLGLAVQETIDVRAERSAVDLRKAEVNLNYNAEAIANVPLEMSYRGLFQLVPGVAENRSIIGPSAGGSRQENTYLIDGVNITNPSFGTLSTEVNQLDIAEFNVKRGGITAEFGRASGIVTNAVSRSGTNQLAGVGRMDWMPQDFIGDYKDPRFTDPLLETVINPAVGVGGPLLRDRLFFYGSARYYENVRGDRSNQLGQELPDRVREGYELFGKVTGTPTPQHLLNVSFRTRPYDVEAENQVSTTTTGGRLHVREPQPRRHRNVGVLPDQPQHDGCEVSLSEGGVRRRSGDGPGISPDLQHQQPAGHGVLAGPHAHQHPRRRLRILAADQLPAARGEDHLYPVPRSGPDEP